MGRAFAGDDAADARPGERLFVDYAGDGVPVVTQIFVAVRGASSFTFARAGWTQALPDWIDAQGHAFEAIGDVPHLRVPDNTKTRSTGRSRNGCGISTKSARSGGAA